MKTMGSKNLLIRIIKETRFYHLLLGVIFLAVMLAFVEQFTAVSLGKLVDTAIQKGLKNVSGNLINLIAAIGLLAVLTGLNSLLQGKYANKIMYDIRNRTINVVESLPIHTVNRYSTGDLISRINNDLPLIESFFGKTISDTSLKIFKGIFGSGLGFYINWKITLILIVISFGASLAGHFTTHPIHRKQREHQDLVSGLSQITQDAIYGHTEIKTFGLYAYFLEKFRRLTGRSVQKYYEISKIQAWIIAILDTVSIGLQIGVVFLGVYFVIQGELTVGNLFVMQQVQQSIGEIFRLNFTDIQKATVALERIYELWNEEPEKTDGVIRHENQAAPVVSFKNVSFAYPTHDPEDRGVSRNILDGISFEIHRNETLALVGPSGCGKSTLIKLICGFLRPDAGEICYRGYRQADWDKTVLRAGISLVEQNTFLFPTSIFDNIACGRYGHGSPPTEAAPIQKAVEQAATQSGLDRFIDSLPDGYQTYVGEWGIQLSGGQTQRVAIARALLKDADFLIMDEPTSALDAHTEQEIQNSIAELTGNKTILIVAHRLSTIKNADRILVLNRGQIVEEGNHQELFNQKGLYYQLYKKQWFQGEVPYES